MLCRVRCAGLTRSPTRSVMRSATCTKSHRGGGGSDWSGWEGIRVVVVHVLMLGRVHAVWLRMIRVMRSATCAGAGTQACMRILVGGDRDSSRIRLTCTRYTNPLGCHVVLQVTRDTNSELYSPFDYAAEMYTWNQVEHRFMGRGVGVSAGTQPQTTICCITNNTADEALLALVSCEMSNCTAPREYSSLLLSPVSDRTQVAFVSVK